MVYIHEELDVEMQNVCTENLWMTNICRSPYVSKRLKTYGDASHMFSIYMGHNGLTY